MMLADTVRAQSINNDVKDIVAAIDTFNTRNPAEKVFLHIDRPYYTNTDTIWIKGYLLNNQLAYSAKSGLLHTELLNDTGRVVMRIAMPVLDGISFGQMVLDSALITEGNYTLRAYTGWMQNNGTESFFTRQIYIGRVDEGSLLAKIDAIAAAKNGKETVDTRVQLLRQDGSRAILQKVQLKLTDGQRTFLNQNVQTDVEGKVNFGFELPAKANTSRLMFVAKYQTQTGEYKTMQLPVPINSPGHTDVQFMPEGGYMVNNLTSRVGIKAIAENGRGVNVTGEVIDSKNNIVAPIKTLHKGMGVFEITPLPSEAYTARIVLPGGTVKSYPLPQVKPSGVVMCVMNHPERPSVMVVIQRSANIAETGNYLLVAQGEGRVCYAAVINFKQGTNSINVMIDKQLLASGIIRFTLLSMQKTPLAERVIYIEGNNHLNINIKAGRQATDSVSMDLHVTTTDGQPVQGAFSIAVTDNNQVKADSVNMPDIATYMLLTSNLKGEIEEPGYYFAQANTAQHLDMLLLTQGWTAYIWKDVFDKAYKPEFLPGYANRVTGKVVSGNRPQANIKVTLLSTKQPVVFRDTVTDSNGRFSFTDLPRIDSPAFIVQAVGKKGNMFESMVYIDEFIPSKTSISLAPRIAPWYVNTDTTLLNYNKQNITRKKELDGLYAGGGRYLQEVIIKGRKVIKGSKFYAGYGAVPDLVLDEKEMNTAKKTSIEQLLSKRVSGFSSRLFRKKALEYMVNDGLAYFFIDGFEIETFYNPSDSPTPNEHYNYVRSYLSQLTAEDVRGIEVKTTMMMIVLPDDKDKKKELHRVTYIEITTWSGDGAFMKRAKGRVLYRPFPVSWPKNFYQPKYTSGNKALNNLPATIFWAPNLITDKEGKAKLTFMLPPKGPACTVIVNGANMDGKIGYNRVKLGL
ncbi:carboxypeptidase regulatory-like domain-containing protein [Mucilaginibacter limnophilus]|uniref:Carboxypeptidase regulatory-like domain-containing protein n=1 Tax=Mucilaginibacter limnophilus TaxID=1932778 RepID=A0A3S2WVQ1_9SPHI|nr:carboxypeptidase-like regulatory domain-containing protein [Mucilaginibacter limnophilus]RVT97200.1 carboxypeptidase regulatory-like domain-containing protein [Mucilaginibacter limnophilus]